MTWVWVPYEIVLSFGVQIWIQLDYFLCLKDGLRRLDLALDIGNSFVLHLNGSLLLHPLFFLFFEFAALVQEFSLNHISPMLLVRLLRLKFPNSFLLSIALLLLLGILYPQLVGHLLLDFEFVLELGDLLHIIDLLQLAPDVVNLLLHLRLLLQCLVNLTIFLC